MIFFWIMSDTQKNRSFLAILIAIFAIIYSVTFDHKINLGGDNLAYYYLGKSLVSGNGYSDITGPNISPHTHFPPGYPLVIAMTMLVSESVSAVKMANGLFLICSMMIIFAIARRIFNSGLGALLACMFLMLNRHLLEYSSIMMSEIPFMLVLVLGSHYFLLNQHKWTSSDFQDFVPLIIISAIAVYLRSYGIILFLAVFSVFLFTGRIRQAVWLGLGFLFCLLPWSLRNWQLSGGTEYISQFLLVNPYDPHSGIVGFVGLTERFGVNLVRYVDKEIPFLIFNQFAVDHKSELSVLRILSSLLVIASLLQGVVHIKKEDRHFLSFLLMYGIGIVLLWPSEWFGIRFLLPLAPFIIVLSLYGLFDIIRRFFQKLNFNHLNIFFGIVLLLILSQIPSVDELRERKSNDYPIAYNDYFSDARWVRKNSIDPQVVACRKPLLFYHFSQVPSVRFPSGDEPFEVVDFFNKNQVDFVVMDALGYASTGQDILPVLKLYPDRFEIIKKNERTPSFVCRYRY